MSSFLEVVLSGVAIVIAVVFMGMMLILGAIVYRSYRDTYPSTRRRPTRKW